MKPKYAIFFPALMSFGPLFMVNLGGDHSFAHLAEASYWLALPITLIGAFMVVGALSILHSFAHRQSQEIELLRKELDALKAGKS